MPKSSETRRRSRAVAKAKVKARRSPSLASRPETVSPPISAAHLSGMVSPPTATVCQPTATVSPSTSTTHLPAQVAFNTLNSSGTVTNVYGDHIVYETAAPPAPHALDLLNMLKSTTMDGTSRPLCLVDTRTSILQSVISDLTTLAPDKKIIWLSGMAGSGKSTISTTLAKRLHDRGQRGAFLFFNRDAPAQSGPEGVIRTSGYL
ncbi:hypothetical protein FIBSPDRAFT_952203 [Athelia psychrophila]|uniref:Nephrocystin 3-like N-terminal domain-containing protein n=1 Tax=Athelia psychrophila TaxID=1759441 RepID=A0A166LMP1_9AGAM|nr:hypothetical protein FIBSPDRAFT_952203 [Fibularhizoctonia sp. CBS 109695]